jgi:hypothetical protein
MFRIGQDVWVGWAPDSLTAPIARAKRCSVGVIHAGPFEADQTGMTGRWWQVVIDGLSFDASERILFPFHDPDTDTEATSELEVTV